MRKRPGDAAVSDSPINFRAHAGCVYFIVSTKQRSSAKHNWRKYIGPLMLKAISFLPRTRRSGWMRNIVLLPWAVLAASLLVTYLLRVQALDHVHTEMQTEFEGRASETINLVEQRMLTYEKVLYGTRGFFAASHEVERQEFSAYYNELELAGTHPGVQGLGYSLIVPPSLKDQHIAYMRKHGFPQYTIRPEGARDTYTTVYFIEPLNQENQSTLGYDMYADQDHPLKGDVESGARHKAMAQARDTNKAVLSGKVKLLSDTANDDYVQAGFLMYLPIYRRGPPIDTVAQRRANILGWVYLPFHMNDLMDDILSGMTRDFDIEVHDGDSTSDASIIYDPDSSSLSNTVAAPSLFYFTQKLEIANHNWTVTVRSLEGFEERLKGGKPLFITYTGSVASVLLALLTWLLMYVHERTQRDAKEIEQSELRLATIIDTALDAVVQMDADGHVTGWNAQAELLFGWKRTEAIGRLLHETIIPPQFRKSHVDGMNAFFQTGTGPVLNSRIEMTAQRRNGDEFPVELAITQLKIGKEHMFTSFIRDITERKLAEQALRISEQRFRDVSEAAGEYLWEIDTNMVYTYVSNRSVEVKGFAPEELLGHTPMDFMPKEDAESVIKIIKGAMVNNTTFKLQHRNTTKNGETLWEAVTGLPILDNAGVVTGLRGTGLNITQRKQTEDELRLASMVYKNSSEAMVITDSANRIIAVNPAFEKLTGYRSEEVTGKDPNILSSGRQDKAFYQAMWHDINSTGTWQGELWDKRKNGEVYPKSLIINTIKDENGQVHRYVALFSDITKKKESEELIWKQANFDMLTGLPNRRMFRERLDHEIKKAHRSGAQLALMLLDLDHFKEINDTLGHDMGDVLLKEAAARLVSCVRESDTVARMGGDEFIIILGEVDDPGSVDRVARTILQRIVEPFKLGDEFGYVSTSVGITLYPDDAADIESLLKNADQAMYVAKKQGRNRSSYFTLSMQEYAQSRMHLVNDLRNSISAGDQFALHYQPIVDLKNGAVHKAEALIRWQHPERGMILPTEFIPIAEETGLIVEIGDWVFYQAAAQVLAWRASHHADFQISINKSPVQFQNNSDEHRTWFDHLNELGLPGHSITIEITEGLLLDATINTKNQLLAFRDQGMQVSIDDFGTGYSSLSYLRRFDIDYLKIDQSFVSNLHDNSDELALCEAIIVMAHRLGIKVIAEGIETVKQHDLLFAAGCDYGQGFLYSEPLPAGEFDAFMRTFSMSSRSSCDRSPQKVSPSS